MTFGSVEGRSSGPQSQSSSEIPCTARNFERTRADTRSHEGTRFVPTSFPPRFPPRPGPSRASGLGVRSVEFLPHRGPQRRQMVRHDLPYDRPLPSASSGTCGRWCLLRCWAWPQVAWGMSARRSPTCGRDARGGEARARPAAARSLLRASDVLREMAPPFGGRCGRRPRSGACRLARAVVRFGARLGRPARRLRGHIGAA